MLELVTVATDDELRRWVELRNRLDPHGASPFEFVRALRDRPEPKVQLLGVDRHGADVVAANATLKRDLTLAFTEVSCVDEVTDAEFDQVVDALEAWVATVSEPGCAGRTFTYDFDEASLRRWAARGWREQPSRKPAVGCRPLELPVREVPMIDGIEFATLADRLELERGVFDCYVATWTTTPWSDRSNTPTFERWRDNIASWPGSAPDQFLLALHGDCVAGYTELTYGGSEDRTSMWHAYTGVRQDYRRRGIARALKHWSIEWCRAAGVQQLLTSNDEDNVAMRSLNVELGYEPIFSYVTFDRDA